MTENEKIKFGLETGKTVLGIEFGSTRIKAVLIDETNAPIAAGSHEWENRFENNIWTYTLRDIWTGLQDAYAKMASDVKTKYGVTLTTIGAIGFSGMMHGYMAFDKDGNLLTPFRTWRNTITQEASEALTKEFQYNIPQRWSIAHLYQAVLNNEEHVKDIAYLTTLAGYVHWKMTGQKVIGVGEASGMFPIDTKTNTNCDALPQYTNCNVLPQYTNCNALPQYDKCMLDRFDKLVEDRQYPWKLSDILPKVLTAGEHAGTLTEEGCRLLDTSGNLKPGIPLCPPEGDAGTGMTATNSIRKCTGNVSAGTSIFAMIVLEKELSKVYPEIDLVTTPAGSLVGMVHCNNCTSDLNAWVGLFREFAESFGIKADTDKLFEVLFSKALEGDSDCGGLLSYNYFSGEPVTGFAEGRPLFVRTPDSRFNLANFMRMNLFTSFATLKIGLDIMLKEEGVKVTQIFGHGGLFKTKGVGQQILAAAINAPVSILETAGEGGAWGIALLASYMIHKKDNEALEDYLSNHVFTAQSGEELRPDAADVKGFDCFIERYKKGLPIERAAVESI